MAGSGKAEFSALCTRLIEDGADFLAVKITRNNRLGWQARIERDDLGGDVLAYGAGATMDRACQAAVVDYRERQRSVERKKVLLENPVVKEAMSLFGWEEP